MLKRGERIETPLEKADDYPGLGCLAAGLVIWWCHGLAISLHWVCLGGRRKTNEGYYLRYGASGAICGKSDCDTKSTYIVPTRGTRHIVSK